MAVSHAVRQSSLTQAGLLCQDFDGWEPQVPSWSTACKHLLNYFVAYMLHDFLLACCLHQVDGCVRNSYLSCEPFCSDG